MAMKLESIRELRRQMREVVAVARTEGSDVPAGWLNTIEQWEQLLALYTEEDESTITVGPTGSMGGFVVVPWSVS